MSNLVIYNEIQLEKVVQQIYEDFDKYKELNLSWEKKKKDKSIAQLGFFWSALIGSVQDFFLSQGIEYDKESIKENFYSAVSYLDDRFKHKIRRFNGKEYEVPLRISEMDMETMSRFIDRCVWLIDNAKAFQGLKLSPDIRNTWVRHITKEDIKLINSKSFPYNDNEYMDYLRKQTCLVCGCHNGIEAHHLRIGSLGGVAKKPPAYMCVPLCRDCHRKYHLKGHEWFLEQVKWIVKYLDLESFCKINYNRWKNHL